MVLFICFHWYITIFIIFFVGVMSPIGGIDLIDAIDTIGLVDDIDMIDSFITIIFDTKKPGRRPGLG